MSGWIRSIAAAAVLSALAVTATPKGRVREVVRFMCGLLCALTVAAPVAKLDVGDLAAGMARYADAAGGTAAQAEEEAAKEAERLAKQQAREAEREAKARERAITNVAKSAMGTVGKAAELGVDMASAAVTARWDEESLLWYPWRADLDGAYDGGLSAVIEAELGIPRERQSWRDHGR